jgi:hypothetical protein
VGRWSGAVAGVVAVGGSDVRRAGGCSDRVSRSVANDLRTCAASNLGDLTAFAAGVRNGDMVAVDALEFEPELPRFDGAVIICRRSGQG